ncbi:MAG: hypothetical protein WCE64_13920 [Bacteroidales bacterium]
MNKIKHILISLSVVFILFLFIDEGKTIILVANNIQVLLVHNQASDLEIPHQYNHNKSLDDETWISSNSFELLSSSEKLSVFPYYQIRKTEDFTKLIWQPPKF